MEILRKYFPLLSSLQLQQYSSLQKLYGSWNEKINVISRKDIDHLYERHVLHSLAIAKFISFSDGTTVLDAGTGGGFPGIPLAIFFPKVKFHLVDSIGKKIKVVEAITQELELTNVSLEKIRAEELRSKYDFITGRAVAPLKTICDWTKHLIFSESKNQISNGWILLKGGDLKNEIQELNKPVFKIPISDFFEEDFFKGKFIVNFK
ncbi:MAG TPA: 16S rRNA (guanine(527)-N(7))-methyltransferase RsmG [Chitinophagales bacterium]|nr:16S rRNA (guanine(527)-N(7))-methyltransferase RsmG [Chitinophagales bacterium]